MPCQYLVSTPPLTPPFGLGTPTAMISLSARRRDDLEARSCSTRSSAPPHLLASEDPGEQPL